MWFRRGTHCDRTRPSLASGWPVRGSADHGACIVLFAVVWIEGSHKWRHKTCHVATCGRMKRTAAVHGAAPHECHAGSSLQHLLLRHCSVSLVVGTTGVCFAFAVGWSKSHSTLHGDVLLMRAPTFAPQLNCTTMLTAPGPSTRQRAAGRPAGTMVCHIKSRAGHALAYT